MMSANIFQNAVCFNKDKAVSIAYSNAIFASGFSVNLKLLKNLNAGSFNVYI